MTYRPRPKGFPESHGTVFCHAGSMLCKYAVHRLGVVAGAIQQQIQRNGCCPILGVGMNDGDHVGKRLRLEMPRKLQVVNSLETAVLGKLDEVESSPPDAIAEIAAV